MAALGSAGCTKSDSPEAVCEHLVAVREAAAAKPDALPRAARMGKCLDNINNARKKMGEAEWATFAPCAVEAKDADAFVACSPTLAAAAASGQQRIEDAAKHKEEAIKAGVTKMQAEKARKQTAPRPSPVDPGSSPSN